VHVTRVVSLKPLARIDALDLDAISEFVGREFLPFPFVQTLPNRFAHFGEYAAHTRNLPDRFNHGDLTAVKKWFAAYADADVRVECRVQNTPADTPCVRVLAHRSGMRGYFASQRPDDVIEMFTLPPHDLAPAIAGTVELTKPGARSQIVIPEYVPQSLRDSDGNGASGRSVNTSVVRVTGTEVTAYATVQSHCRPARDWGLDQDKNAVVWVRINDDGEYIYAPGYRYAKPMSRQDLSERIDRLIAEDAANPRESRDR
jgi:hypothetical protein